MRRRGKKKNLRLKRSVRRTVGALLMVSAITVAAIPVPETRADELETSGVLKYPNYSYKETGEIQRPDNNNPGFLTIDDVKFTSKPTIGAKNGTAYVISKTSTGDYQLDWQFNYYSPSGGGDGYITDYNSQYSVDAVSLSYRVYSDYVNLPAAQISQYYNGTAVDTDIQIYYGDAVNRTVKVKTLGHVYILNDNPDSVSTTLKPGNEVYDFFHINSGLIAEYDKYVTDYRAYLAYEALTEEEKKDTINNPKLYAPSPITKTYKDIYETDVDQTKYLCESLFGKGTELNLQIVDKRVYNSGVATKWEQVWIPKLVSVPSSIEGNSIAIGGQTYYFDSSLFLASNFASIVGVADGAFKNVQNVRTLTMANEISYIGDSAFESSFLESVSVARDATVGNRAFAKCSRLSSVNLPQGVQRIGAEAFSGCPIVSILIPDSITEIGDGAFYNCLSLRNVKFEYTGGSNAKTVGDGAFYNCPSLSSVDFGIEEDKLGANVTELGDACFAVAVMETGSLGTFQMPNFIVSGSKIGQYLFGNRLNLEKVIMPNNLDATKVTNTFVYGCSNLECIEFPSGSRDARLDPTTFYTVNNPKFYVKGPKTNAVGSAACNVRKDTWSAYFNRTKGTIQDGDLEASHVPYVYSDGDVDYYEVSDGTYLMLINSSNGELTSVSFADGVVEQPIGTTEEAPFRIPAQVGTTTVKSIKDGCFNGDSILVGVLDYIIYLDIEDGSGINYLNNACFKGAKELKGVKLGNSVETIGDNAFSDCPKLEKVEIGPAIRALGSSAFESCPKLTKIIFDTPASLTAFTVENIGVNALTTGSEELTVVGSTGLEYAPFVWAMDKDNYVDPATGLRVCYKTTNMKYPEGDPKEGQEENTSYTIIVDNTNLLPTVVDIPQFEDLSEELRAKVNENKTLTNTEQQMVNASAYIVIPQGVKSIDVAGFINKSAAESQTRLSNGISTEKYIQYSKDIPYYNQYKKYGLFNGYYGGYGEGDALVDHPVVEGTIDSRFDYASDEQDRKNYETDPKGNDRIVNLTMYDVEYMPDMAFESCEKLETISLGNAITDVGALPFYGCSSLNSIACGSGNFVCENGILYKNKADNTKAIVECLPGRGDAVGKTSIDKSNDPLIAQVSSIEPRAFENCDSIKYVYFDGATQLKTIPADCFKECDDIREIDLPANVTRVDSGAFSDISSDVRVTARAKMPNGMMLDPSAFKPIKDKSEPMFITYEAEQSREYASSQGVNTELTLEETVTVKFLNPKNYEDPVITTVMVVRGNYVREPAASIIPDYSSEGLRFIGWQPLDKLEKPINEDTEFYAQYGPIPNVTPGINPEGTPGVNPEGTPGVNPQGTPGVNPQGTPGVNPQGTPGVNPEGTPGAKPEDNRPKHRLTVIYGSGTGDYPEGTTVIIEAIDAPSGKEFDKWVINQGSGTIYSATSKATTIEMGSGDVTITATYKNIGAASSGGGSGSSSTTGTTNRDDRPVSNGTGSNTIVNITKPGISNVDKAYASVSGSTDSFIVKVTESADAANQVATALAGRFADMSPIKYFAMDISLYDSTGINKIENVSGISVNVTIPIPDALAQYGGNNRVGAVANGVLEDLPAKFVSIDGIPCVSFTATHFSPYTIYVDTNNLTAGTMDYSPKTGDPIHPKWFVSIALAAASLFMFLKRDKRVYVKA